MAQLEQNPISYPWSNFLIARQMRNQNLQDMYKNITGIGTGLGDIGKTLEQQKAKQALLQALQGARNGGIATSMPDATGGIASGPDQNYTPQTPQQPSQPQSQNIGQLAVMFQTAFPGQPNPYASAMANQYDPEKQANIRHLNAETEALPQTTAANTAYKQAEVLNQQMQMQISKLMQEGRLEEAKTARESQRQLGLLQAQIRAQSENAKHPFRNMFGMKPLVNVPESLDSQPAPGFAGQTGVKNFKRTPK